MMARVAWERNRGACEGTVGTRSMSRKAAIWILAVAWVAVLGGVVWVASSGSSSSTEQGFCTADARLDAPEGWQWARDAGNDCAWTLYADSGEEALDDVYQEYGFEPPPTQSERTAATNWVLLLVAIASGATIWFVMTQSRCRSGNCPEPGVEEDDGRDPSN